MWKEAVVLAALVCVTFAAPELASVEPKENKIESTEGCYISELGAVIPFGKSAPSKVHCGEYRCKGNFVEIASCGKVTADSPCYTLTLLSEPYPGCCEQVQCS